MKAKKNLLGGETNCVEVARSHYYLGAISLEASKVALGIETLNAGMDILRQIFPLEDEKEMDLKERDLSRTISFEQEAVVNADVAAMTGALGWGKLVLGEVDSAKGTLHTT